MLIIALAGPLSNVFLAVISAVIYHVIPSHAQVSVLTPIAAMLELMVSINVSLTVLNLIPIPPLDGSRVIECLLPHKYLRVWVSSQPIGFLILLTLLVTGVLSSTLIPFVSRLTSLLL